MPRFAKPFGQAEIANALAALVETADNISGWTADFGDRRSGRDISQSKDVFVDTIAARKPERRPGTGEIGLALAEHDRVHVDAIFIDQAQFGETVRKLRPSHFNFPGEFGLQCADRAFDIIVDQCRIGAHRV